MPLDLSIKKVLILSSSPKNSIQKSYNNLAIIQACKSLSEKEIKIVIISSTPDSLITDSCYADEVYIEPITIETVKRIIKLEKVDSLLPVFAGQNGSIIALKLSVSNFLSLNNVKLLGSSVKSINYSLEMQSFKDMMLKINEPCIPSKVVTSLKEAVMFAENSVGYPVVVRPAVILGSSVGHIVNTQDEMIESVSTNIRFSPLRKIIIEKSVSDWKEIDYVILRDSKANCVIAGCLENIEPVGTSFSNNILVAPPCSLSEEENKMFENSAVKIVNALEITGECSIRFALKPNSREYAVIEINPGTSDFSSLLSKATLFPISKISTLICAGYTIPEIINNNDIKNFVLPKINGLCLFSNINNTVMAFGHNFEEALNKCTVNYERSEGLKIVEWEGAQNEEICNYVKTDSSEKIFAVYEALKRKIMTHEEIYRETKIDWWFLDHIQNLVDLDKKLEDVKKGLAILNKDLYLELKANGFSDEIIQKKSDFHFDPNTTIFSRRTVEHLDCSFKKLSTVQNLRNPNSKNVFYAAYDCQNDAKTYLESLGNRSSKGVVIILDSDDSVFSYGLQTDYSCVNCAKTLKSLGYETVLINNSSMSVVTDIPEVDRIYLEPLSLETVMSIVQTENPVGVVTAFGGKKAIEMTQLLESQNICVFGPTSKEIEVSSNLINPENVVSENKYEVTVLSDGINATVCGIVEIVCDEENKETLQSFPPLSLSDIHKEQIFTKAFEITKQLEHKGLVTFSFVNSNNNYLIKDISFSKLANIPLLSKMTKYPIIQHAVRIMLGETLEQIGNLSKEVSYPSYYAVKIPTLDFEKKINGYVLGISTDKKEAYYKGLLACGNNLSSKGNILFNIQKKDIAKIPSIAKKFNSLGFVIYTSEENSRLLNDFGIESKIFDPANFEEKIDYIISSTSSGLLNYSLEHKIPCLTSFELADYLAECLYIGTSIENIKLVNFAKLNQIHQKIHFYKFECSGTDYILINQNQSGVLNPKELSVTLCDRKKSIGAEKLILLKDTSNADISMKVFTNKGESQKKYGNAIRAAAKYLNDCKFNSKFEKSDVVIETETGMQKVTLHKTNNEVTSVSICFNNVELNAQNILICAQGLNYNATKVFFENDFCVIFSNFIEKIDAQKNGPLFESNEAFENGADVLFVKIENSAKIKMRVWQKNVGELPSSPSGAIAAVLAGLKNGYLKNGQDICVELPGGQLIVNYTEERIILTGKVNYIFEGDVRI